MFFAAGCGSSSRSPKPEHVQNRALAVATDPATIEGVELAALPAFPKQADVLAAAPPDDASADAAYLEKVFNLVQTAWETQFKAVGLAYQPARLVFFSSASKIASTCRVQAEAGPFYCGAGLTVYLDERFLDLLSSRSKADGFAGPYVVSQLVGRHVQRVTRIQLRADKADRFDPGGQQARIQDLELQADCLSGVWAHSAYNPAELTGKDIEETLEAVAATGRDFQTKVGEVRMDTGLWSQPWQLRARWFDTGFRSGEPAACRTFSATQQ
jgi:predicted metalloprotease